MELWFVGINGYLTVTIIMYNHYISDSDQLHVIVPFSCMYIYDRAVARFSQLVGPGLTLSTIFNYIGGWQVSNAQMACLSLAVCCSKSIKPTNHFKTLFNIINFCIIEHPVLHKRSCMHGWPISFHSILCFFYLLYHNITS